MNLGVLSFRSLNRKSSYEELQMKRIARDMGLKARILRVNRFQMVYDQESPQLLYNGKRYKPNDVIITRPSVLRDADLHLSIINQMEFMGMALFNRYKSIINTKNKIKTIQILEHFNIPIPKTVVLRRKEDIAKAAKLVNGFPLIVKAPFGSFGNGVTIIESMRALQSFLTWNKPLYLLQQYVKHSRGKDIRIFVVNGEIKGAMMRSAKKGEFRSNIELGGKGMPVEITEEEKTIALRSVQALNLTYGGVDIMRGKNGPVVLEVNSNPGFKTLEAATGVNIARSLVEYAIEYAERRTQ
ncbi:RimK family alpha-L-glutamate ligase [Candidatus Peregrinibacteria bacterium]|nr:RimK family alpha-L-glutamate ligase [Candidatus Peregrinibacteria bacterium]